MEYFTEQALTYPECLDKIRQKYGEGVQILMRKSVRIGGIFGGLFGKDGVEIMGIVPQRGLKQAGALAARAGDGNYAELPASSLAKSARGEAPPRVPGPEEGELPPRKTLDFEVEKKKVIAAANRDPTLQMVLSEVRSLKEKLDAGAALKAEDHPSMARIEEILTLNDFSSSFRQKILDRTRKEFSLEALGDFDALQDKVVEWIGESITVYREERFQRRPRIMALVGPTGVGKTTTIAKLAAVLGIGSNGRPAQEVRLVTIDGFRIGAKAQIEAYGYYMDIPVFYVDDYDELRKTIAMNSEKADLILVDTIGKSPRDSMKLGEMKHFLDACGSTAEIHLVAAASTKASDLGEIFRQFEPFNYQSVIITKMDETIRIGNVVSVLSERGKAVSYITDGQKVPNDIQRASVVQFLLNLEGFRINRAKIESLFPRDGSEKREWR
jgi:flagellar biosynthesis protein FlhF